MSDTYAEQLRTEREQWLLAEVEVWNTIQRIAYRSTDQVSIVIDGRTELTIVFVGAAKFMLPVDRQALLDFEKTL